MVQNHHQFPSFNHAFFVSSLIKTRMASLVELTVVTVALHSPVPELLAYIENLPTFIRRQLFQNLSKFRLREMEVAWEAAANLEGQNPRDGLAADQFLFDRELQREWEARLKPCHYSLLLLENLQNMKRRTRNSRHVFWELEFLSMFERRKQQHFGYVDEWMENQKLFVGVVRVLILFGIFICKENAELLLALRYLRSLEVQCPDQQYFCWETIRRLVNESRHLTELKFAYGSLSDSGVAHLYTTLAKPAPAVEKRLDSCRITVLELNTVEIQPEGYRMLVALVRAMPQLLQLRVDNCIKQFDKKLLVEAALRLPALERLFLGDNCLEDDAFVVLAEKRKPLPLRHLHLDSNNVSFKTIGTICRASMDGVLNLELPRLTYNPKIRVPAIHALTPMLASPVVRLATGLTHLELCMCNFGLEGVTSLLIALGLHRTLTHLDVAYNDFYDGFGGILADFLLTNCSVTHLKAGFVYLEQAGVSARLLIALESNLNLTSLSLAGNRLCSGGVTAILGALIKRARVKPFALVDLSKNEIELDGLKMIVDMFEGFINANGVTQADSISSVDRTNERDEEDVTARKHQVYSSDDDQRSSFSQCNNIVPIQELRLRNNLSNYGSERQSEYTTLAKSIQRRGGHHLQI